MTHRIHHTIDIDAPPAAVWEALTDTASFPEWNPFIRRAEGELVEGARLEVEIAPPGGRPMTFKPNVLAVEDERELRWLGHLLVPGLFDGEHSFRLERLPGGGTRLTQAERFSGLLVRPSRKALTKTEAGFEQMNGALKQRIEQR